MDLFTAFSFMNGEEPPIPAEEEKYYQEPSYYKDYVPSFALDAVNGMRRVIPFAEQMQNQSSTANGLYRTEIALLKYCSYGTYPHPRYGYPGLWWFEYGIKNVGYHLQTLEKRGFIQMNEKGKYFLTEKGKSELESNISMLDM